MGKRGQAAMEFLMTYGWAILAVILSIAALAYFGVLNPSRFLPESCTLFPGVACKDFTVTDDGDMITIFLINGIGSPITIGANTKLSSCGSCIVNINNQALPQTISDGQTSNLSFYLTSGSISSAGSKFKSDIILEYQSGNVAVSHTRTGSLVIKVPSSAGPATTSTTTTSTSSTSTSTTSTSSTSTSTTSTSSTSTSTTSTSTSTSSTTTVLGTTLTFYPTDDARVLESTPTTNFGAQLFLQVESTVGGTRLSYLKFTVSGVTGTVTNAVLFIETYSSAGDVCTATSPNVCLRAYSVPTTSWTEGTITWNTRPAFGSVLGTIEDLPTINTWNSIAVTSAVTGDGVYSFGLDQTAVDFAAFYSEENTGIINDPYLQVTFV